MSVAIFSFLFFICLGVTLFYFFSAWLAQVVVFVLSIAVALLFLLPIVYLEVIRRPKAVLIGDPLVLTYRTRKPREVRLEDIERVSADRGDQSTLVGRINTGGRLWVRGETRNIFLTYEIANLVREEYAKRLGRYPPERPR